MANCQKIARAYFVRHFVLIFEVKFNKFANYASKIDLLCCFEIDIRLRGNQKLDSWNDIPCYLKLSAFANLDREGADYHNDKHIFTHILHQYAIDYDMGTTEMCRRYLNMNRNQANIQSKIFHFINFMRAMNSGIVPFFLAKPS